MEATKQNAILALERMIKAAEEFSNIEIDLSMNDPQWDFSNEYPFNKSFDEVILDLKTWHDDMLMQSNRANIKTLKNK